MACNFRYKHTNGVIVLVLDINPKDAKGRLPIHLCFTPPTATFLAIRCAEKTTKHISILPMNDV